MIPKPVRSRFCPRCDRNVMTEKGRHGSTCEKCGCSTRRKKPRVLRARKPIWATRAEAKAAGDLTEEQWVEIGRFYSWRCAWCEFNRATEQDHVHPLCKGGRHTASNVVPACHGCNQAKGSSTRWVLKRPHPFMEQSRVLARGRELETSFEVAPIQIVGRG